MFSPTRETHIPSDTCSSARKTHIRCDRDVCVPLPEKHTSWNQQGSPIPSDMCSPPWAKHILSDIRSSTQETHLTSNMCSPPRETGISLVISVPLPRKHTSLVICVPLPGKHISLVIGVPLHRKHPIPGDMCSPS